jgi:beta-glucosidase
MKRVIKYAGLALGGVLSLAVVSAGGWLLYHSLRPRHDISPGAYSWPKGIGAADVDRLAREVLDQMTLDEKIDQMSGEGMGRALASMIFRKHFDVVYAGANDRLGVPPVAFTDGPRGVAIARSTSFPVAMARAATWDVALEKQVGDVVGKEARAAGANYFGGLCVNLLRHPSWGRAQETYGEDPWLLGEMGLALMKGVQAHNVMACAKHFALNSIENSRFQVNVEVDERTLREVYLPHFRKLVDHGVASIMSAYNRVRGEYCGHNPYLLTTILRDEWGFEGFVTSDWMWGLRDGLKGVRAGMDVEMPAPRHYGKNLRRLVKEGRVAEGEIDTIVFRILRTKLDYATRVDPMEYPRTLIAAPDHVDLSRRVAERSMVLLKNEGPVLPLDRSGISTLAVVGHLANIDNTGDRGSSNVNPRYRVTPLSGLRSYLEDDVRVLHNDGTDLEHLAAIASQADAVVVVAGFRHDEEGEYLHMDGGMPADESEKQAPFGFAGGDRVPLGLKERDLRVIRTVAPLNPRVVVALVSGTAVAMEEWKEDVPAILMAWYFGMEGGNALARVLFGEVNPGGKLPFTIPVDEAHLPPFDPYAPEVEYGYYHGYTLFDRMGYPAAFPFGFGLSYTSFSFDRLQVETPEIVDGGELRVSVEIRNTGLRRGDEVAQLYVGFENSAVDRPVKLLRGFERVSLEPGASKTVGFRVPAGELAWYNPGSRRWEVENIEYPVFVGSSSRPEDLLRESFRVVSSETRTEE